MCIRDRCGSVILKFYCSSLTISSNSFKSEEKSTISAKRRLLRFFPLIIIPFLSHSSFLNTSSSAVLKSIGERGSPLFHSFFYLKSTFPYTVPNFMIRYFQVYKKKEILAATAQGRISIVRKPPKTVSIARQEMPVVVVRLLPS